MSLTILAPIRRDEFIEFHVDSSSFAATKSNFNIKLFRETHIIQYSIDCQKNEVSFCYSKKIGQKFGISLKIIMLHGDRVISTHFDHKFGTLALDKTTNNQKFHSPNSRILWKQHVKERQRIGLPDEKNWQLNFPVHSAPSVLHNRRWTTFFHHSLPFKFKIIFWRDGKFKNLAMNLFTKVEDKSCAKSKSYFED